MQLTGDGITTITETIGRRFLQLIHIIRTTVLNFDDVFPRTAGVPEMITDFTSHHTFSDFRVCSNKPAWRVITAAILRNTFVRHPIPCSSLETVPTCYQVIIVSWCILQSVPLSAVRFIKHCVMFTPVHWK